MTPEQIAAFKLTPAQRRELARVCRTNGGGIPVDVKLVDGEAIPTNGPLAQLFRKGLIQGKAGSYQTVVHTRDGLDLFRTILKEKM